MAVLAMLTGCNSYQAIAQFDRDKGFALAQLLGARWVASRLSDEQTAVIALDGKTLRGSRDGALPGHPLVAAYAVGAAAVLAQVRVDAKTNEPKAALQLLSIVPVAGRIVRGDAIFCQRHLCQKSIAEGGDYVVTGKDNPPSLALDIRAGLSWQDQQRRRTALFSPQR